MAQSKASDDADGDTSNIATTLAILKESFLFQIPPKASSMGHSADSWPKKAIWVGRLKVLSTATQCILQFEDPENDKVYLKVLVNTDPDKPDTIEPCFDSTRYFALNVTKPGSDQIFELGLGFQSREDSMDFKMGVGEFERMRQNLEEAKQLDSAVKEDFSLGADEVLVMKPIAKKKKKTDEELKSNDDDAFGDAFDGFLPPPSEDKNKRKKPKTKTKAKKKKKKKTQDNANDDGKGDSFGDFTAAADGGAPNDSGWATFD